MTSLSYHSASVHPLASIAMSLLSLFDLDGYVQEHLEALEAEVPLQQQQWQQQQPQPQQEQQQQQQKSFINLGAVLHEALCQETDFQDLFCYESSTASAALSGEVTPVPAVVIEDRPITLRLPCQIAPPPPPPPTSDQSEDSSIDTAAETEMDEAEQDGLPVSVPYGGTVEGLVKSLEGLRERERERLGLLQQNHVRKQNVVKKSFAKARGQVTGLLEEAVALRSRMVIKKPFQQGCGVIICFSYRRYVVSMNADFSPPKTQKLF